MTKYETALANILDILTAEVIYNVDFEETKGRLNRLIEKRHDEVQKLYLALIHADSNGRQIGDEFLTNVYYGHPMAHTMKAFVKRIPKSVPARAQHIVDACHALVAEFTPACEALAAAKTRVIKARKPSGKVFATPERTIDNTGTCACCGMNVKLNGGKIVAHGYTIRWGFQSGNCFGVGYKPIEVSNEGLVAMVTSLENTISHLSQTLEYGCLSRLNRQQMQIELSGCRSMLARTLKAIAEWKAQPLPDGKKDHM